VARGGGYGGRRNGWSDSDGAMIVQGRVTDWFRVHSSSTAEIVSVSYVEFDEAPDECRCRYLILSRLSNAIYPRSHVGFCSESSLFSHTTCISFVRQIHRKDLEPFLISMIWGRESHPESSTFCIRGCNMPEEQVARCEVERVIRGQLSRGG
jgi:hypothetical protein